MSEKGKRNHHYWKGFKDGKECPAVAREMASLKKQLDAMGESVNRYKDLAEKRKKSITGLQRYNLELRKRIGAMKRAPEAKPSRGLWAWLKRLFKNF